MNGYFASDSIAVEVMSNRAVGLTYGQRALVIGAAHPLLFHATLAHTSAPLLPYNRLVRTAAMFETVFLGSKDQADRVLAYTRRRHATVVGRLSVDAGIRYPAGTAYAANDPHLMFLTMAFAFDAAEAMQDLLVRRLQEEEREGLWADFVRWGELFGMPRSAAPPTYGEFRTSFDELLRGDDLFLTDQARVFGAYLAGAQRGDYDAVALLRPLFRSLNLVVQGSLPQRIRDLYGFDWTPAHEMALLGISRGTRSLYARAPAWLPNPLRIDPLGRVTKGSTSAFLSRAARAERWHLQHGRRSMPGLEVETG